MENNNIELIGRMCTIPSYSHEVYGEKFYETYLEIPRMSGAVDVVKLELSNKLIKIGEIEIDKIYAVSGSIRTYNKDKKHLLISVLVDDLTYLDIDETIGENDGELIGYICKKQELRYTPLGRMICDIVLAVNRPYGKSDYIPCVVWGKSAQYISGMPIGEKVIVNGRLQSREYIKDEETHTVYEFSVQKVDVYNEENQKNNRCIY